MKYKTKIMVVEDEVLVAENIKEVLEDFGYQVTALVSSGEAAIRSAELERPDLVIMDIILQGAIDGIEAAGIIQRDLGLPVIFLTAHSDHETLERAKISEPYAYITKPFEDIDLQHAITIALYRKSLDRKLEIERQELEEKFANQTKVLEKTNKKLSDRVAELTDLGSRLKEKSGQLENANTALRYLITQREQDIEDQADRIMQNINNLVLPHLKLLLKSGLNDNQRNYVELINSNIREILKPFAHHLTSKLIGLTTTELKVADLVKNGKRNKEISEILCIAPKTVEFHRENIRRKLGILNSKSNLRTYLNSL